MKKKFVKGTFELDVGVTDLSEYEEKHRQIITRLLKWAEFFDVAIILRTSNDNHYLCEYMITGETAKYCLSLYSELKQMLKSDFPKFETLWQGSGDILYILDDMKDQNKRGVNMSNYERGRWDMFELLSSICYDKQMYFLQDDGSVYSRLSGDYLSRDNAIKEFCDLQHWNW